MASSSLGLLERALPGPPFAQPCCAAMTNTNPDINVEIAHHENASGFTPLEEAFFAEGDELSKRPAPPVDNFEDLVG